MSYNIDDYIPGDSNKSPYDPDETREALTEGDDNLSMLSDGEDVVCPVCAAPADEPNHAGFYYCDECEHVWHVLDTDTSYLPNDEED